MNGFFVPLVGRLALTGTASFFEEKNTVDGSNTDYINDLSSQKTRLLQILNKLRQLKKSQMNSD
jgi:hypothetical protein